MRYVAAYLLASLGGNKNPSEADIEKILGSVGIEVDKERSKKVISELSGKNVEEIITNGKSKLASMPAGGGAVAAGGAPAAGGSPAKEEKVEAKKEESDEGSDDDMGFGLFD
ncbi:60S acidic ribosomal protein P2-like [Uloborus diversus]|uniref:60S acidic ribosomal protein P2-like n=1 Tax=Uloborus diversus TaxID=327109 RepID=UPI0024096AB4|nr:60S acidic ribosomal protein P2-like [Uloborus diversus]